MKTIKTLAISILAIFAVATVSYASNDAVTALTTENGENAGSALLGLYNQYKTDGKIDLTNKYNVVNLLNLSSNIADLSKQMDNKSFLAGLLNGGKSLVNENNSATVLESLAALSNLDLSFLQKKAIERASLKALKEQATDLLSRMLGHASQSIDSTPQSEEDTNTAVSLLGNLFSGIGTK